MKILIPIKNCEHIKELSHYNDNYYKLPFMVEGIYSTLREHYSGDESFDNCSIGYLKDGKYIEQLFLNCDENKDYFVFDSDKISKEYTNT